jgi:hypothetical protein
MSVWHKFACFPIQVHIEMKAYLYVKEVTFSPKYFAFSLKYETGTNLYHCQLSWFAWHKRIFS